jgi:hypothetical protein
MVKAPIQIGKCTSHREAESFGPVRAITGIKEKQRTRAARGSFAVMHREAARLASADRLLRYQAGSLCFAVKTQPRA